MAAAIFAAASVRSAAAPAAEGAATTAPPREAWEAGRFLAAARGEEDAAPPLRLQIPWARRGLVGSDGSELEAPSVSAAPSQRAADSARGGQGHSRGVQARGGTEAAAPAEQPLVPGLLPEARALMLPCGELVNLTSSAHSPVADYWSRLGAWLREDCYQPALSLAMAVFGLLCAVDGPRVWQALFTAAVAAAAACVACYEAGARDLAPSSQAILVVQVVGIVGMATWSGFEGTQVLLGAVLGCVGAYGFGGWARAADGHLPGIAFAWYSVGAGFGVVVNTTWRQPLLAALAPLLGGFLVAASSGALLSRALAAFTDVEGFKPLPPPTMPWSVVAAHLLGDSGPAILAGHGACALAAVLLQSGQRHARPLATAALVACVLLTAAGALLARQCHHLDGPVQCPAWLKPSRGTGWQWSALGCLIWGVATALAAWRQFGLLQDWESKSMWKGNGPLAFFNNVPFGVVPAANVQYTGLPAGAEAASARGPGGDSGELQVAPLSSRRSLHGWRNSLGSGA